MEKIIALKKQKMAAIDLQIKLLRNKKAKTGMEKGSNAEKLCDLELKRLETYQDFNVKEHTLVEIKHKAHIQESKIIKIIPEAEQNIQALLEKLQTIENSEIAENLKNVNIETLSDYDFVTFYIKLKNFIGSNI
jgi:GTP-binding protein EngB required for normal cell division